MEDLGDKRDKKWEVGSCGVGRREDLGGGGDDGVCCLGIECG